MSQQVPYCGSAPSPGLLLSRFNDDPVLILLLILLCAWHIATLSKDLSPESKRRRTHALCGWLIAGAALVSPLCALSVSLFSARVAQHMVLFLAAAPSIARALPRAGASTASLRLWMSATIFFACLWVWHMPDPYDATFASTWVYWSMHVTLFGSSILLWRELLDHSPHHGEEVLAAALLTFMHMGLLGAVLTLADRPMFLRHLLTTQVWGLTPLQDQTLGGALMCVPGFALFSWSALRSIGRLWKSMEASTAGLKPHGPAG